MIRIALCDDEPEILDEVSTLVKRYAEEVKQQSFDVFSFQSTDALVSALEDGSAFDIFVLDVYIGDDMGTTLARRIRQRGIDSPIVFLTSSIEHAPESFEMGTLRYLLKPLRPEKLYEAMDASLAQAERMGEKHIKLKTENGVESLNANRILYSEAHDHHQYVTLDNGQQIKVRMTVSELYTALMKTGGFVRVGSAYVINLRNIKNVATHEVHLYNDINIPIPRGKHAEVKRAFWDFQCEGQEI